MVGRQGKSGAFSDKKEDGTGTNHVMRGNEHKIRQEETNLCQSIKGANDGDKALYARREFGSRQKFGRLERRERKKRPYITYCEATTSSMVGRSLAILRRKAVQNGGGTRANDCGLGCERVQV